MTGFHDDAIQRILNLLGFWRGGGGGVVGVSHLFDLEKYDFYTTFRGFLRKNLVLNSPYFDFF